MARSKDGSMMTEKELREVNQERFLKFKAEGTLGNNGPLNADGSTSMGKDRWSEFTEQSPESKEPEVESEFEEILATGDKTEIFEGDELVFAGNEAGEKDQGRGLNGNRDKDGNLKTEEAPKAVEAPVEAPVKAPVEAPKPAAEGMLTNKEPTEGTANVEMLEAITEAGLSKEESTQLLDRLKGICG